MIETPAGMIVRYFKDHLFLVAIIAICILVYILIFVAHPRWNWLSHSENMDKFLHEKDFLKVNLEGLLNSPSPQYLSLVYSDHVKFQETKDELKQVIGDLYGGNVMSALTEYFILYPTVQYGEKIQTLSAGNQTFQTERATFLSRLRLYLSMLGQYDTKGKGENEQLKDMHDMDVKNNIGGKVKLVGDKITLFMQNVKKMLEVVESGKLMQYLVTPDMTEVVLSKITSNIQKYKNNKGEVYSEAVNSKSMHGFSWYIFEAQIKPDLNIPPYDVKLRPYIINYLNSDVNLGKVSNNKLIKNDALCNFLDKRPIYSRLAFSINPVPKGTYEKLLDIYKKIDGTSKESIIEVVGNIDRLRAFLSFATICNLYLNVYSTSKNGFTRDTIMSIYASKYKTSKDFFMELIKPYFDDFVINRVWANVKKVFSNTYWKESTNRFKTVWEKIGYFIMNMPTSVANGMKKKKDKENFIVVEGFLKAIFGPLIAIGKFFISILKLTLVIVDFVMNFAKDPFGTLIKIFTLILTALISIFLAIIYTIWSLPPFIFIIQAIYFLIFEVVKLVALAIVFLLLFGIIAIIVLILAILNQITKGKLAKLMLCQNSPGSWYRTPNYHLKNIYERSLLCAKPCMKGFAPDPTGLLCRKVPGNVPSFCPQAAFMRIYSGYKRKENNIVYNNLSPVTNFKYQTGLPETKESMLISHFKNGNDFVNACAKPMDNYNKSIRSLCENIEYIERAKPFGLNDGDVKRLRKLCTQSYCGAGKGTYGFCKKVSDQNEFDLSAIIKQICLLIFAIVMITILIVIMVYHMQH